jgi:hypothetical protein
MQFCSIEYYYSLVHDVVTTHTEKTLNISDPACGFQFPLALRHRSAATGWWECGFESRGRHGCLSVASVVCCQVEVSASRWSLVQGSSTECGACV